MTLRDIIVFFRKLVLAQGECDQFVLPQDPSLEKNLDLSYWQKQSLFKLMACHHRQGNCSSV
jgi:hypothetical protein